MSHFITHNKNIFDSKRKYNSNTFSIVRCYNKFRRKHDSSWWFIAGNTLDLITALKTGSNQI
ncbi:hypothetical protein NQ317_013054 [Molorchus minor]|uniref:Uncharacterized protein n=1 Tax=Molorchus minor TaxID=1323400 RepID=A0ABQ9K355_9CUCU|nr:hypothetical protein NQ317_013054 [Molorchus minor]